jgi:hypothetical protein
MKTIIQKVTTCCFGGFLLIASAFGDEPAIWDQISAEIPDVKKAGGEPLRFTVRFQSDGGVNGGSLDSADLWVTSANGFHSAVRFVEWRPFEILPGGDLEFGAAADYELPAPEGGWSQSDDGDYAVILADGEVAKRDGSHFGLALAGSFKVAIGEEKAVIPALGGEISIETFATPGAPGSEQVELAVATVKATFPYPVEVDWGKVTRTADGDFCLEVEGCVLDGPVPEVVTTYEKSFELGMFAPGTYQVEIKSGASVIAVEEFSIGGVGRDWIESAPISTKIEIVKLPTRGLFPVFAANVRLTYGGYVEKIEWSEVKRDGQRVTSKVKIWINPTIAVFTPVVVEHQVPLGMFQRPGEYHYHLFALGEILGREVFSVEIPGVDFKPPTVRVHGAEINSPGDEALEFAIEFHDESELETSGIEAQVLTAMNSRGEIFEIQRTSLQFTADFTAGAIANYRMVAPGGSWGSEDRGRFRLLLSEPDLVCDLAGNHLTSSIIGYLGVNIEPEDPEPINPTELMISHDELIDRWTAAVRLYVPEDLAARDDWEVAWGEARPVGPAFFMRPRFVRAGSDEEIGLIPSPDTNGAGMWVEHDYDLGPVSGDHWIVLVQSNLGHLAKGQLIAGGGDGEMAPFDHWSNWAGGNGIMDFWEYCVGTDPGNPGDDHLGDPRPEVIHGEDGKAHLGLRCRMAVAAIDARLRFEGSRDMITWMALGPEEIEESERMSREGGIEEFVVCLAEEINNGGIKYLRAVAERW